MYIFTNKRNHICNDRSSRKNTSIRNSGSIKKYFQYAGVVYPLGMVDAGKAIQFTSELIEKVVHVGYSDEQEEAYVYLLKKK
ncbi:DUF4176 domain-containing protein [Clostridium sp. DSM 17811]|nr:DUF4176 domain-containing protein [Clostridium sp. DSM 17811]